MRFGIRSNLSFRQSSKNLKTTITQRSLLLNFSVITLYVLCKHKSDSQRYPYFSLVERVQFCTANLYRLQLCNQTKLNQVLFYFVIMDLKNCDAVRGKHFSQIKQRLTFHFRVAREMKR